MRILKITWLDSIRNGGWQSNQAYCDEADYKGLLHTSVGYEIQNATHSILLAQSKAEHTTNICDTIQIPKRTIIKIKVLK
jgi:hypothetical protein